jgi:hypothetical protein
MSSQFQLLSTVSANTLFTSEWDDEDLYQDIARGIWTSGHE